MDADRLIAHLQRGADALRPLTANDYRDNPQRCDQAGQIAYDAMVLLIELLSECKSDSLTHEQIRSLMATTKDPSPEQVILWHLMSVDVLRKCLKAANLAPLALDTVVHLRKFGYEIQQTGTVNGFTE